MNKRNFMLYIPSLLLFLSMVTYFILYKNYLLGKLNIDNI